MAITEELRLDLTQALSQIDDLERQLDSLIQPITIPVTVQGEEALDGLKRDIDQVEGDQVDIDVDVDGVSEAGDEFEDLRQDIDRTEDSLEDVSRQADKTGRDLDDAAVQGSKGFGNLTASVGKLLLAFAAVGGARAVISFLGDATQAASALEESTSKATVVFGDFNDEIQQFASTAPQALGLSTQTALEFTGTFGNLFTSLGLSREAAADLSPQIVQLGADLASFNNIDVSEALEKLRSGLVGEVEPLRALGVALTAATVEAKAMELGLVGASGELTEAAKVQARYALILEQTTNAQGDFARTSDGFANSARTLAGELENARAALGEGLLPAMTAGVGIITDFLPLVSDLAVRFANLTGAMTDAEATLALIAAQSGGSANSATALAVAFGQVADEIANVAREQDVVGRRTGDFVDLRTEVEALTDAWGGGAAEIQVLLDNLDFLQDELGLTDDAVEVVADVLRDRLGVEAAKVADDILRNRLINELERSRAAAAAAALSFDSEADALTRAGTAAREAGVSLFDYLTQTEGITDEQARIQAAVEASTLAFLGQQDAIDTLISDGFDALPGALEAAKEAMRDEEGEIISDFSDFVGQLAEELRAREAFESNLAILRAFGLEDLADVFAAEGLEAAGALADAVANPAEARQAENLLGEQYSALASSIVDSMRQTIEDEPVTPALIDNLISAANAAGTPEVKAALLALADELNDSLILTATLDPDVIIPPHFLEGIDVGTVVIPSTVAAPSGGSSSGGDSTPGKVTQGVSVTINNPTTNDLQTDAARASQEIGAVVRNLPE